MQYKLFTNYKFFSLGSGSSGNCYYLGNKESGILIDAGIGIRSVKKTLKNYGVSFESIHGILLTHDHSDHIRFIGAFGDKHNIPVYATKEIHHSIQNNQRIRASQSLPKKYIDKDIPFYINDIEITAFEVPHDSTDNVGYHINFNNYTFVLITDIGLVTNKIKQYASKANHLVVEANYDEELLQNGKYPEYLKKRICSGRGHLANHLSADLIASICHSNMHKVQLCHLSQDNNSPELALETVKKKLEEQNIVVGKDIKLEVLSRYKSSGLTEF